MWEMSQLLGAKIHQPSSEEASFVDKILAKIIGRPEHWTLARQLSGQLQEDDIVYCDGESLGIAIATLCGARVSAKNKQYKRPKIAVLFHNSNRIRGRLALKLFDVAKRIDLFVTFTNSQTEFLRSYLRLPQEHIYEIISQPPIDTSFFKPGLASVKKLRPLIASGGLEKRDYRTLANAIKDLDVDVKVCAYSPNAKKLKKTFPEAIPQNMSFDYYDWCDLVQLYRDSDLVVVPLFENNYQAGMTTMLEAMACRQPVIITRSPKAGIINELIDLGIVTGFNPGDSVGLKEAIEKLLNDPQKAQAQAQKGYEKILERFNHHQFIQSLVPNLFREHDHTQKACN
ncbi:MAG: glycosyltransferase family 4 protein [Calothrix sp. SM1_7_51]|nr:glycosyltransferase family 4 protein [Calothrix sp. SM1_7_51]